MDNNLAAIIVLHGGPSPEEFQKIHDVLFESTVDATYFSWGPSHALAEKRLEEAQKLMAEFMEKLCWALISTS